AASPDSDTGRALAYAIGAAADIRLRELIAMAIGERDALELWLEAAGGVTGAAAQLSRAFDIKPDDSEERIAAEFLGKSPIQPSEWAGIARIGASGKKTDKDQAERFTALPTLAGARQIERYIEI